MCGAGDVGCVQFVEGFVHILWFCCDVRSEMSYFTSILGFRFHVLWERCLLCWLLIPVGVCVFLGIHGFLLPLLVVPCDNDDCQSPRTYHFWYYVAYRPCLLSRRSSRASGNWRRSWCLWTTPKSSSRTSQRSSRDFRDCLEGQR